MGSSPFRRLFHWGPIAVLGIIKLITWSMVHLLSMWWPPQESPAAAFHAALFLTLAASTLYFFLQALLEGPGFVPLGWKPEKEEDVQYLQFCTVCNGYKAPRSHHCKKCGYCVKKMDHHCPWINCCVGHNNHGYFNLFLTAAVLGCFQATVVLSICIYHGINRVWYKYNGTGSEPVVYLTIYTLPLTTLAVGMAIGVVLAVGVLLYYQIKGMIRNQTTIEEWILEKAKSRRSEQGLPPFIFPYNVGVRRNLGLALFGYTDGIHWPLREGCGPYDLTREQIAQKKEKRLRSRVYMVDREYSGARCPLLSAPRASVAAPAPCARDCALRLRPGQTASVTTATRHWLFGELQTGQGEGRPPRGWFPRCVATPVDELKPKPKPD